MVASITGSCLKVADFNAQGYSSRAYYDNNEVLVLDQIREGYFSNGDANLFMPLVDELLNHDQYMLLADY